MNDTDYARIAALTLDDVVDEFKDLPHPDGDPVVHYRATFPFFLKTINKAAIDSGFGCPKTYMSRYISLHALSLVKSDPRFIRVSRLTTLVSDLTLQTADTIRDAKSNDKMPYNPEMVSNVGKLRMWSFEVGEGLQDVADTLGVFVYQVAQIYGIRSIITSNTELGSSLTVHKEQIAVWERWLDQRAWDLYSLVEEPDARVLLMDAYLESHAKMDLR